MIWEVVKLRLMLNIEFDGCERPDVNECTGFGFRNTGGIRC